MQNHKVKLTNACPIFISKDIRKTDYGSYEFVIEDIDGRLIGIGLICSNDTYFENSNYL